MIGNSISPEQIIKELSRWRYPLNHEKRTQELISSSLTNAGIEHQREVRLTPTDIVDFMVGDIAIEVKLKGQRRAILKQCERYATHEAVQSLVLVTNAAMGFPPEIHGKPCYMMSLGKAWL